MFQTKTDDAFVWKLNFELGSLFDDWWELFECLSDGEFFFLFFFFASSAFFSFNKWNHMKSVYVRANTLCNVIIIAHIYERIRFHSCVTQLISSRIIKMVRNYCSIHGRLTEAEVVHVCIHNRRWIVNRLDLNLFLFFVFWICFCFCWRSNLMCPTTFQKWCDHFRWSNHKI